MLKRFALAAVPFLALSAAANAQETAPANTPAPQTSDVVLQTSLGNITITLETQRAPITSANFLRYIDEGRFDGAAFYRAMKLDWGQQPNGLIQGGTQMAYDRILEPIAHEPTGQTGILHKAGTVSMARYAPGTATGDFTIMLADMPGLDAMPGSDNPEFQAGFAAFGHVKDGMDVVRAIWNAPISQTMGEGVMLGQMIAQPVEIIAAARLADAGGNSAPMAEPPQPEAP